MIVIYPDVDASDNDRGQPSSGVLVEPSAVSTCWIKAWDNDSFVHVELDPSDAEALAQQILRGIGKEGSHE